MLYIVGRDILHLIRVSLKKKESLPAAFGSLRILLYPLAFAFVAPIPGQYWCAHAIGGGDLGVGDRHYCRGCSCRGGAYCGGFCLGGHGGSGEHCDLG
jgi:hypothetical protein